MDLEKISKDNLLIKREACPACGSTENVELYKCKFNENPVKKYLENFYGNQGKIEMEFLENGNFDIRRCDKCNLVYQNEILGDYLMNKLYEEWIDPEIIMKDFEAQHPLGYYIGNATLIVKIINQFNKKPAQLNFFDFGMGWSNWSSLVRSFGVKSHGSELSKVRINHAKKIGINVIDWEDLPNFEFDFINTDQVFEHIPEPKHTLEHLAKSLKKGGLIRISVPDGTNIIEQLKIMDWDAPKGHKNSLNTIAPLEHINCFNTKSIITMAESVGLKWYDLNYYPCIEYKDRPLTKKEKLIISIDLIVDTVRPLYQFCKKIIGKRYIAHPNGTNLFFIKE